MTATASSLALGDLLAEHSLGIRLLTGGPEAVERPIAGAHAIEVDGASRWLAPHWAMLTTGLRLRNRPDAQRELVRELDAARIGALGFGTGITMRHAPAALLDEAERRGYPIFEVPIGTPFREVVSYVSRSLIDSEVRAYQRLPSIQRYLLDALSTQAPERTLVARLAELTTAEAIVFADDGDVEQATDDRLPAAEIWTEIDRRRQTHLAEFEVGRLRLVAVPTSVATAAARRWLATCTPVSDASSHVVKLATQTAASLLAAVTRIDDLGRGREHERRAALLQELLDDETTPNPALSGRAAAFGLDPGGRSHLFVVLPDSPDAQALTALLAAVRRRLERDGLPALATARDGRVVALVERDADGLREWLGGLPGRAIGVGRPITALAGVPRAYCDACQATQLAGAGRVSAFVDCDLSALLVSGAQDERIRWTIDQRLRPLREHPQLLDTLTAYFEHELDVTATARALHVHPNTLRYRLTRIETVIGRSLRHPATIAELHIALTTAPRPLA
ncbi:PucR family transcriptional regulator [Conexibacter arvalis]|uniref:Purine catabolism regulator n=1 Tax=Conexibacter arvalis TaxID=912552 RepID=A0A840I6M1_9ACTN|nr:PucR family transcriptional regulator [Conexibacter arvalis]MBB4660576.1 purine catabolism regulator [Conexibacter arvalis]